MQLNIVECRGCGASWWTASPVAGAIDGGPCCKGLPVLDIETYPTERMALAAFDGWIAQRKANIAARLQELGVQA